MAEEGGGLQAEPPAAEHVALLTTLQAEADVLVVGHLDEEGQAHMLRGHVERTLFAIGAADEDAGVLGQSLQKGVHAVPPQRDGQGLGLLDALPSQPGGKEGGFALATGIEPDKDTHRLAELPL